MQQRPVVQRFDSRRGFAVATRRRDPPQSPFQQKLTGAAGGIINWCRGPTNLETRAEIDEEFEKGLPNELDPERRDIKIVCISDTHNTRPSLPRGDVLIHAGDLTNKGTFEELQNQLDWINEQMHAYKIVVAGNHDKLLDEDYCSKHPEFTKNSKSAKDLRWGSILYLQDSEEVLNIGKRQVRIYGSPQSPNSPGHWAFQHPPDVDVWKNKLPDKVDIVISHSPPYGHLDDLKGDPFLNEELARVKPRLVVCGHIHEACGEELVLFDDLAKQYDDIRLGKRGVGGLTKLFAFAIASRLISDNNQRITRLVNAAAIGLFPDTDHDNNNEPRVIPM